MSTDDLGQFGIATSVQRHYGFLDAYSGFFRYAGEYENEVNELGSLAETASDAVRTEMRVAHEDEKWDEEYYMLVFYVNLRMHVSIDPLTGSDFFQSGLCE